MRQSIQALIDRVKADHNFQRISMEVDVRILMHDSDSILNRNDYRGIYGFQFLGKQIHERWIKMQQLDQQRRDLENLLEELKGGDVC